MARKSMVGTPVGDVELESVVEEVAFAAPEEEVTVVVKPKVVDNSPVVKDVRYRVLRSIYVMVDGQRVPFREGKVVTTSTYDVVKLLDQGVDLQEI